MGLFLRIRHRIAPRWQRHQEVAERDLQHLWNTAANTAPRSSPDTQRQWQRLDSALSGEARAAQLSRGRLIPRLALAGALAAMAVIGVLLFRDQPQPERFVTARGEQLRVLLPDSSEVLLNHTSTLRFERRGFASARSVAVTGEAYFRVRKTGSPFVVTTDVASIHVVGTVFNVRVRDESYEVGVTEGIVRVTAGTGRKPATVTLARGNMVHGERGTAPDAVGRIGFADYPGWTHGKMMFAGTSVEAVCKEIEDRFDVRIQIADPALRTVKITGILEGHDGRSTLSTLCLLTGRNQRYENGVFILY